MPGAEVHSQPGDPDGPTASVDLVVIGHVGRSVVKTSAGCLASPGGSGYAVATSAAALIGRRVGLVAQVGNDFDLTALRRLQVDLDGVLELPGRSADLHIDQFDDGTRSFRAELGVAAAVRLESFPSRYLHADYIHLGTAPPDQQLAWLRFLHGRNCTAQISADMFEHYVAHDPGSSRAVCENVDLIFMNEAEHNGLYADGQHPMPKAPLIVKRGSAGASLIIDGMPQPVSTDDTEVVDPTGGGEILAGVFLALSANGLPRIQALGQAVKAATSCVEESGVDGPRLRAALQVIRDEVRSLNAS